MLRPAVDWIDENLSALLGSAGAIGLAAWGLWSPASVWYGWTLGLASSTFVVAGAVLSLRDVKHMARLRRELEAARDPSRVFVSVKALGEDWQISLEQALLSDLCARGFRPTIFVPRRDYAVEEQDCHLHEILLRQADFVGGFVIASNPEERQKELRAFCDSFSKPVIFLDTAPFESDEDYPSNTRFVGIDSAVGGRLAAVAALVDANLSNGRILVLASNTQTERQNRFVEEVLRVHPECVIDVDQNVKFSKEEAELAATRHLKAALDDKRPYDVVFCTSDSMTMGCLDAIERLSWGRHAKPRVIGYDGTPATLRLVRSSLSPLERVVRQDAHGLAVKAVDELVKLAHGKEGPRLTWLPPELYPGLPVRFERLPGGGSSAAKDSGASQAVDEGLQGPPPTPLLPPHFFGHDGVPQDAREEI